MEKEFLPYDIALALKELGFDESCLNFYFRGEVLIEMKATHTFKEDSECIKAPLYQQSFRWFREKYKIECYVNSYWKEIDSSKRTYYANYNYGSDIFYTITKEFETHEEAELECLKKLIEIVKDGKK